MKLKTIWSVQKKLVEAFDLGEYHKYPFELLVAKEKHDKERVIKGVQNMINESTSMGNSQKSRLYKHKNAKENNLKSDDFYKDIVLEIIKKDTSLDFVKNDPRIKVLLKWSLLYLFIIIILTYKLL